MLATPPSSTSLLVRETCRAVVVVTLVLGLGACSAGSGDSAIVVSAAASLSGAFEQLAAEFEAANPDIEVQLNIGGSSALREQIVRGAPIDVFAAADAHTMAAALTALEAGGTPEEFAASSLTIAVPPGNPADVDGLADLADPALVVGLCAAPVPCGAYSVEMLTAAGIQASVDTYEPDVRSLALKIALGEVDVGIVYSTTVLESDGRIAEVPVDSRDSVRAAYSIAALDEKNESSVEFVGFVLSDRGQEILVSHGFELP